MSGQEKAHIDAGKGVFALTTPFVTSYVFQLHDVNDRARVFLTLHRDGRLEFSNECTPEAAARRLMNEWGHLLQERIEARAQELTLLGGRVRTSEAS